MTLEDLWKLTRRYWIMLAACACVGLALAAAYTWTRTKQYTATAQALVAAPSTSGDSTSSGAAYSSGLVAQQRAAVWADLATSRQVTGEVIKQQKLSLSKDQLATQITATVPQDKPIITVSVSAEDPARAKAIANSVVDVLTGYVQKADPNTGVAIKNTSSAVLPRSPSYPKPAKILPIGLLAGLVIGYLLALIQHRRDTRVRSTDDVEENLGASVLGVIPATRQLAAADRSLHGKQDFATREALRQLRTNLRFVDVDHDPRSIVITSARMSEGKSTVAAALAWVIADSGDKVILVDADLRRPAVAGIYDLDSSVGLTQVLAGTTSVEDALQPTDKHGLFVLTAGQIPPNPSELLGSQRMKQLLDSLTGTYRVILDAPPLLPVTDAALLSASADGAVVVVAASDTRVEHVQRARANLEAVGGRVLGGVLNRVNTRRINRIMYGDTQYGHGAYGTYAGEKYYGDAPEGGQRSAAKHGQRASTSQPSSDKDSDVPESRRVRRRERAK
ncbi:chromosome partitioning protein [Flexivirga endophytica]|uniref:non-specific protein-tyrosine kinase n=1 Tax=Flexivirga endophytica TaxID=1849103 RepID=A0A916WT58_9MICO|nr:polysaccharide biosynthesis tyrosine autokinase [Flexivirga endophytica]GGB27344.1 chromosome partitioning protein [Flexivirga endophytica]GHB55830.1 chromosome partitioning protein [Flexivirga endophytica]